MGPNDENYRLRAIDLLENLLFTARKGAKLYLLLDLDNTLIHCRRDVELNLANAVPSLMQNVHCCRQDQHLPQELFDINMSRSGKQTTLLVKMRPHARRFLQEVHSLFNIRIVSKGHREYVESALNILDPSREILTKDSICMEDIEATGMESSSPYDGKNKFINQCLENLGLDGTFRFRPEVLIIDDTELVWGSRRDHAHVLKVDRYTWLDDHKDELLKIASGAEAVCTDFDEQLLYLIEPLKRLHQRCLSQITMNVPSGLLSIRSEILQGVVLCFSGIRLDVIQSQGYKVNAEFLGARVIDNVEEPSLTLLVAKKNTEKVKKISLSDRNIPVVFPLWIHACIATMHKIDVAEFDVKKMKLDKETGNFICPLTVWEALNVKRQSQMTRVRLRKPTDLLAPNLTRVPDLPVGEAPEARRRKRNDDRDVSSARRDVDFRDRADTRPKMEDRKPEVKCDDSRLPKLDDPRLAKRTNGVAVIKNPDEAKSSMNE